MELRSIVIGMDGSPSAVSTAHWVAETLAPRAQIVLAHAEERLPAPSFLVTDVLAAEALEGAARAEADARERANAQAHTIAADIRSGTRTIVRVGQPHEVVAEVAREVGADLIAVGAHGNRAHERLLLGTTADRLVRLAPVPVLVGSDTTPPNSRRVLVGVDDEESARRLLACADLVARQLDARLTVLHVLSNATYSFVASLAAAHAHGDETREAREVQEELQQQAHQVLAAAGAAGVDISRIDTEIAHGAASECILAQARREGAAVIVLGRHRAARGWRGLLGGTVTKVLHAATCGVVVVPPGADQD